MKTLILSALLLTGVPAGAFDLKGVELGQRPAPGQIKAAFGFNCGRNTVCSGDSTINGQFVKVMLFTDATGAVSEISARFGARDFSQLDAAARAKYGTPSGADVVTKQNGFGAQFESHEAWWIDAAGARVFIVQFTNSTEGLLMLESAARRKASEAYAAAQKAKSRM
jgi:hypothetical protein